MSKKIVYLYGNCHVKVIAHMSLLLNQTMPHVDSQRPGGDETLEMFGEIV